MKLNLFPGAILPGLCLFFCVSARAATTNVTYANFSFTPKVVTINVGDTVQWNGPAFSHTASGTGADPICGGNFLPCSHQFNTAGTYPYQCNQPSHASFGMTGTVIVQAAPPPPANPALLTNAVLLTNGQFQFKVVSTANRTNIVQASTNLSTTNWVSIGTNVPNGTNTFIFTDVSAPGFPIRIYRVVQP